METLVVFTGKGKNARVLLEIKGEPLLDVERQSFFPRVSAIAAAPMKCSRMRLC